MSTIKKLVVIASVMLACINLFAVQVEGSGDYWGVKGTSTLSSTVGYLGHFYFGAYGENANGNLGYLGYTLFGVYGEHYSGNQGHIASIGYGAYGKYSSGNLGYLGSFSYGAYGSHNLGNYGYLASTDYGVYGKDSSSNNYGYIGSNDYAAYAANGNGNYAYLGSSTYGAYGANSNSNYGILGHSSYGVYGRSSSGNYGYIGSASYGVFGRNNNGNNAYLGSSTRGLYAYAASTSSLAGQFLHVNGSEAALAGSNWGAYIKGLGSNYVYIGTANAGIEIVGTPYAGNFLGDVLIQGDLYVTGDKDNVIKMDDGTWVTMSATEAPYPEYTISGRTKLSNGIARIEFEEPYPQVISSQIPIKVIVTPEGSYSGIYVKDVTTRGFTAVSEVGDLNATFSWMAIARVKGREQKTDYKAVTEKIRKLETSQKLLGLSTIPLPPSSNEVETPQSQTMEMVRELSLSVNDMSASGSVRINYQLPKAGSMTLSVFDASGRLVRMLASTEASAGNHTLSWNRTDDVGRHVPTGVYFVRLDNGAGTRTAKVTIVK